MARSLLALSFVLALASAAIGADFPASRTWRLRNRSTARH
jgi:hypothetical protein